MLKVYEKTQWQYQRCSSDVFLLWTSFTTSFTLGEAYIEFSRESMVERFCENFHKSATS